MVAASKSTNNSKRLMLNFVAFFLAAGTLANLVTSKKEEKNAEVTRLSSLKKAKHVNWECGQPKVTPAFTHGMPIENAVPHSWPWAVSILARFQPHLPLHHYYGGSIVAPRWVLSCGIFFGWPDSAVLRTGAWNVSDNREPGSRDFRVESMYDCPLCTGGDSICPTLLKLTESIEFNDHTLPICLADSDEDFFNQSNAFLPNWPSYLPGARSLLSNSDVMKQWNLTVTSPGDTYGFSANHDAPDYADFGGCGVVKWRRDRWLQHALLINSDSSPPGMKSLLQISQCCEFFANVTEGEVKCRH